MTELNNEMLNALDNFKEVKVGDIVKGEVLSIQDDKQVIVGIDGTGVEGVIPFKEISNLPFEKIEDVVNVGDHLELIVISSISNKENGNYLLSKRRLDARKAWENIEKEFANGDIVEGTVKDIVRGGLVVDLGVRGFVPASMISDHYVSDFSDYKGKTLKLKIMEIDPSENRLILSHREIMEEEREKARQELLNNISEGDIIEGTIARLTDFGAFIDLGGIDGLVHISEIAHQHVTKPEDVLTIGDVTKVKILSVDTKEGRVSLSIKATKPTPWEEVATQIKKDDVVDGVVKRLTDFGAFVEIYPGVEGLVHISQISHKHIATPHEVLKEGQKLKFKILDIQPEEQRVALSLKALEEMPKEYTANHHESTEENDSFKVEDIANIEQND